MRPIGTFVSLDRDEPASTYLIINKGTCCYTQVDGTVKVTPITVYNHTLSAVNLGHLIRVRRVSSMAHCTTNEVNKRPKDNGALFTLFTRVDLSRLGHGVAGLLPVVAHGPDAAKLALHCTKSTVPRRRTRVVNSGEIHSPPFCRGQ